MRSMNTIIHLALPYDMDWYFTPHDLLVVFAYFGTAAAFSWLVIRGLK